MCRLLGVQLCPWGWMQWEGQVKPCWNGFGKDRRHRVSPLTVQLSLLFAGALARAVLQ